MLLNSLSTLRWTVLLNLSKAQIAITTHGVFPGDAVEKIQRSGLFERIVATDSHPNAPEAASRNSSFLEIIELSGVLHAALQEHP